VHFIILQAFDCYLDFVILFNTKIIGNFAFFYNNRLNSRLLSRELLSAPSV
jgi:hypothetical protein